MNNATIPTPLFIINISIILTMKMPAPTSIMISLVSRLLISKPPSLSSVSVVSFGIISSLSGRANSRSAAGYANLFRGYFDSFGPLLILTAITLIVTAVVTPSRMKFLQLMRDRRIVVLLISALVPIFENMLLRGHAIVYTFDRLKFAPFLIVIFILTIDSLRSIRHKILIGGVYCTD